MVQIGIPCWIWMYILYYIPCDKRKSFIIKIIIYLLLCPNTFVKESVKKFWPANGKGGNIIGSQISLFGDRGTWTLTIFKVDGFSYYYKFHCCRYWHVEWDSIFILVRLISSFKELSDFGVNDLMNEYSTLSSMWNQFTSILPFFIEKRQIQMWVI